MMLQEASIQIANTPDGLRVESLTIAEGAGVEHRATLQLIENHRESLETFGPLAFEMRKGQALPQGGFAKATRIALLNEQQSSLLLMMLRNTPQVLAFKIALVKAFFEMAQQLADSAYPKNYPDALRAYAAEVEAKEALASKVALDAPKVLFADAVATSASTILIGDLAKILRGNGVDIGANRLFARMRDDGYLIRRAGADWNMPTQRAMDLGLFKVKETAVTHSDGHVTVSKTPKVTGKGQAYFIERYCHPGAVTLSPVELVNL